MEVYIVFCILTEELSDKYLGLSLLIGVDRSECFKHLVGGIIKNISGWKEKILSTGAKEVLLKVVAQAIPAYTIFVFNLPKNMCKGITDEIP